MRHWVADKLIRIANWLDGSGWDYDEFDHGYREGMKVALCRQRDCVRLCNHHMEWNAPMRKLVELRSKYSDEQIQQSLGTLNWSAMTNLLLDLNISKFTSDRLEAELIFQLVEMLVESNAPASAAPDDANPHHSDKVN